MVKKNRIYFNKKEEYCTLLFPILFSVRQTYPGLRHSKKRLNTNKLNQESRRAQWKDVFKTILKLRYNNHLKDMPCFH